MTFLGHGKCLQRERCSWLATFFSQIWIAKGLGCWLFVTLCSCLEDTLPSMLLTMRLFVSLCPLLSDSAEVRHHPAGTIIAVSWHRSVNTCHHNMLGIYMSAVCQLQDYSKGRWKVQANISAILRSIWMHAHAVTILVRAGVHVPIVCWLEGFRDRSNFGEKATRICSWGRYPLYACGTCWLTQ